ncbi:MAG TPA: TorF family putative porin, partial [Permianibacter sp.]|nr:TorF family putative porin [Permianibacter sp.]
MMNKHWVRTAVAAAMLAGSGAAMAEVTGNVAVVSDYLFDGITQTQNDPAVQGGVDWAMESGLYLGAWASNVDFDTESDVETDWYVGYGFGDENVSFDFGYVMYMYLPDDDDADYDEIYFGVTFAENTTLKYWHARDYFN